MKKILLAALCIAYSSLYAQEKITIARYERVHMPQEAPPHFKVWQDILIMSNKDTIWEGSVFKLGKGSLPNGDFNYIATPSNTMEAKLKHSTTLKQLTVKTIERKGKEKYGYKYILKADGGYLISLEDAILTGEIIYESPAMANK